LGDLKQPFEIKGMDIYVDVTLGISLFPMHGSTSSVLLRKAKIASHIASEKHLPYFIYEHETASRMEASQKLLGNVPTALAENQFQLHYQPIVRLSDGHIVGLESLIRWQHPDMGSIPPLDFIPTLERSSLIREVNDWVMTTAVNDLDYFSSGGFEGFISINISSRTLFNSSWLNRLEDILKTTSIDPSRIVFEITETAIIIDPEMTSTHVNRLCNSGTSIALDDFGSGYASLEAVRQLPINYLKIDRKFTQNLTNSREDQEIITAAITLSNAMKDEVIAEGVETQETYDWLKTADCEYAQGYFICRPGPKEEITQFMEKYQPQVE
jgi:EAL domain-containing protein (putative c-di-GMP-specific phosphodiesterase class I)